MKGGKIISKKRKSCIIKPALKCKNSKKKNKNSITKIVHGDDSKNISEDEFNINLIIKNIKNYQKWSIITDTLCEPPDFNESLKLDKSIQNCFDFDRDYSEILYNKTAMLLTSKYGGISLEKYFNKNKINTENKFLQLMNKLKNILFGLKKLNENNISHNDIKSENIVIKNNTFKIIDFGISSYINNYTFLNDRSYKEFITDRFYLIYPPEFIYSNLNDNDVINELNNYKFRKNFSKLSHLYKILFNIDFENYLYNFLINYKPFDVYELNQINSKLDVYSFGMMIINLFYKNNFLTNDSLMIKEFFYLFTNMCNPDYKNRLDINKSYELFTMLLKKYNKKKKSKRSKRKSNKLNRFQ